MAIILHTSLTLINKGTGTAIFGDEYSVELYDKDMLQDDLLGKSSPDQHGNVLISFDLDKIKSIDSPAEKHPDLYFKVLKNNNVIFQSNVVTDLNINSEGDFNFTTGKQINLGTYLIESAE
ncbi:MAG: hypothetical protein NZ529_10620 [Cytophagaceae bacterium]|nr:hypothetical protein [Cytophagaceae bacterium]MDW8457240.1 hypothetical protein [Cytophagaceae bacterium]